MTVGLQTYNSEKETIPLCYCSQQMTLFKHTIFISVIWFESVSPGLMTFADSTQWMCSSRVLFVDIFIQPATIKTVITVSLYSVCTIFLPLFCPWLHNNTSRWVFFGSQTLKGTFEGVVLSLSAVPAAAAWLRSQSFIFTVITSIIHSHPTTPNPQGWWGRLAEKFWTHHEWHHYLSPVMDYLNGQPVMVNSCPDISCKVPFPWWNIILRWLGSGCFAKLVVAVLAVLNPLCPFLALCASWFSYLASLAHFLSLFWNWKARKV